MTIENLIQTYLMLEMHCFKSFFFHRHFIPIYLYLYLKETEQKQYVQSYPKIGNIENPSKDVANPNALIYDQFSMKPKIQ